jgi:hypothetical protein
MKMDSQCMKIRSWYNQCDPQFMKMHSQCMKIRSRYNQCDPQSMKMHSQYMKIRSQYNKLRSAVYEDTFSIQEDTFAV